jgi:hypothetical protein
MTTKDMITDTLVAISSESAGAYENWSGIVKRRTEAIESAKVLIAKYNSISPNQVREEAYEQILLISLLQAFMFEAENMLDRNTFGKIYLSARETACKQHDKHMKLIVLLED